MDLNTAYHAANPGDIVQVPAGTYPQQTILYDASKVGQTPVTFVPQGGRVLFQQGITLGDDAHDVGPASITFDGGPGKDFQTGDHENIGGVYAFANCDRITLRNMRISEGCPVVGGVVTFASPSNLLIEHCIVGPGGCGMSADGLTFGSPILFRLTVRAPGDKNPTNVTIQKNLLQGTVRNSADWDRVYKAKYGPCPLPSSTDHDQTHNDVLHAYGADNFVFDSNVITYYDVQAVFLEEVNGGYSKSGRITNNYFGEDVETTWHAIWTSLGLNSAPAGTVGYWLIAGNTLSRQNAMDIGSDQHGRYGNVTIDVIGNLGGRRSLDSGYPGTLKVNFKYNIWTKTSSPWVTVGDPTDIEVDAGVVDGWGDGAGHLVTSGTPPVGFVKNSPPVVLFDIDGDPRPAPWTAGCDEPGGAPPPPPPSKVDPVAAAAQLKQWHVDLQASTLYKTWVKQNPKESAALEAWWASPTPQLPIPATAFGKAFLDAARGYHYANGTHP